jgi:hypothetical protein
MLSRTSAFNAKHDLDDKTPLWLVHFDGETTDYVNHKPTTPDNTLKQYLKSISSLSRSVSPEEGKASVSGITINIQDYDNEITALLATDAFYFHRKKTIIKVGYAGLAESDLITTTTGWVTGLKLSRDGLTWIFSITDPIKWMQRKIFRGSESSTLTISGNPINILLACLTSTGNGTNGNYDYLAAVNGLGIDTDFINVTAIEAVRDTWFPGASYYMKFTIDKRIKAKDFFEREIFKPLNLYPIIDVQGKFFVRRFAPPLITSLGVQTYNEDNIIGLPGYDTNLAGLINEVEFFYNHNGDDFVDEIYYIDSTSLNGRGPGKKPLTIKTKGLHSDLSPASITIDVANILARRKNAVFSRFATPPIKLNIDAWYTQWISEAGDIVPITHSKLPDIESGTRGLSEARMEIIKKDVDFKSGKVKVEALNTGFAKDIYFVISPSMTVTAGASGTEFTVSATDAAKYANFTLPEVRVSDAGMRSQAASITILTIDTTTGVIICDDIGSTPSAGWIITFADYDNCTDEQKLYGFFSDATDDLGAADDNAHLIVP